MTPNNRIVYLNNCHSRDHVRLFGEKAFFDLDVKGQQSERARDMQRGQLIVVADAAEHGDELTFGWYSLEREELQTDKESPPENALKRVFYGPRLFEETLNRVFAARSGRYSPFFKESGKTAAGRGHLKNGSVFYGVVDTRDLPPQVAHSAGLPPRAMKAG